MTQQPKEHKSWDKEFDLFWGIAPVGSLKHKKGVETKSFISSTIQTAVKEERERIKNEVNQIKLMDISENKNCPQWSHHVLTFNVFKDKLLELLDSHE